MEQQNINTKIDEYVWIYTEITSKVESENAALEIMKEIAKDIRMKKIQDGKNGGGNGGNSNAPASHKQLSYLKSLGVDVPEDITKQQASKLIDEALEGQ